MKKPMIPQPGNVKTQVRTISFTTPQSTQEIRFAAPTPMMAVVFVCVVETGIPAMEDKKRQKAPAKSAANP